MFQEQDSPTNNSLSLACQTPIWRNAVQANTLPNRTEKRPRVVFVSVLKLCSLRGPARNLHEILSGFRAESRICY